MIDDEGEGPCQTAHDTPLILSTNHSCFATSAKPTSVQSFCINLIPKIINQLLLPPNNYPKDAQGTPGHILNIVFYQ